MIGYKWDEWGHKLAAPNHLGHQYRHNLFNFIYMYNLKITHLRKFGGN